MAKPPYQFFGPATAGLAEIEFGRLNGIAASLERSGYRPDLHGHVRGHVLRDASGACFVVMGGKHRTAVLVHGGAEVVPVAFHPRYPRLVDVGQVDFWPRVEDGTMSRAVALAIAEAHVAGLNFDPGETVMRCGAISD